MSTKKQVFSNCQPFYNLSLLAPAHDFQNFCLPETLFFALLSFLPAFFSFCSLNFNVWISIHYIFQIKSRYCGLDVKNCIWLLASLVAQTVKKCACNAEDLGSVPGSEIPWRRAWQPIPGFLFGVFHGLRSLEGYSPWCHQELDTTQQLTNKH